MQAFLIPALNFVRTVKGAIIVALVAALLVQTARIEGFKFWPVSIKGLKQQVHDYRQVAIGYKVTLDGLAKDGKRQIEQSQRNVDKVVEGAKRNPQAERVEKAPLPGGCKSPPEVMSADL